MLRIDRELWSTGKAVIMNSSFGALKGLLVMVMSTFLGLTMSEGQKEEINIVNW